MVKSSIVAVRWWGVLGLVLGLSTASCRLREGEHCLCADECRSGLACVTSQGALRPGECTYDRAPQTEDERQSGICTEDREQQTGEVPPVRPGVPSDPSKRDLPPVGETYPGLETGLESTATDGMDATGTAGADNDSGTMTGTETDSESATGSETATMTEAGSESATGSETANESGTETATGVSASASASDGDDTTATTRASSETSASTSDGSSTG